MDTEQAANFNYSAQTPVTLNDLMLFDWHADRTDVLQRDILISLRERHRNRLYSRAHLGANERDLYTWRYDWLVPRRMARWRHRQVILVTSLNLNNKKRKQLETRHLCKESCVYYVETAVYPKLVIKIFLFM